MRTKNEERRTKNITGIGWIVAVMGLMWTVTTAHAQFTANNQTITISSGTSNYVGHYYVGNGYYGDVLIVTNGAQLVPGGSGYLGYSSSADSNNAAIITGAGSVWNILGTEFQVGRASSGNRVTVSAGGALSNLACSIGVSAGNNSNTVLVTDTGSVWTVNGGLEVGPNGSYNSLTVSNGAALLATTLVRLGLSGNSNTILVTGAGSCVSNSSASASYIGQGGTFNRLTVSNCGKWFQNGAMNFAFSSGNDMLITGTNSTMILGSSGTALQVGNSGTSNTLTMSDGGTLYCTIGSITIGSSANTLTMSDGGALYCTNGSITIGNSATATNCAMLITGTNSYLSNGTGIKMGGAGSSLTISNGGALYSKSGDLNIAGATTDRGNWMLITGTNSNCKSDGSNMYVGNVGDSNQLTVAAGGVLVTTNAATTIGYGSGAQVCGNNNQVLITGPGSVWSNKALTVGYYNSTNNIMTVSNRAVVYCSLSCTIGDAGPATSHNQLTIADGAVLISKGVTFGASTGTNNTGLITGPGSVWTNHDGHLVVGASGRGGKLTISNGAALVMTNAYLRVGQSAGGNSNTVLVTGAGSYVTISGSAATAVGEGGAFNSLTVSNGGTVFHNGSAGFSTGSGAGTAGNGMLITGTNSAMISISGQTLTVGNSTGGTNTASVADGGVLELGGGLTINGASTLGNTVTNAGGIYQFISATPSLTTITTNNFFINNGTLSFRGITTADVLCNQSAKPFDSASKMAWVAGGTNTFRLNNATNTTTGQAYTFSTAYGATNFARLDLVNGSMYRTNVTLGAGGSLYVAGGPGTISGVLTAQDSSATIEIDLSNTNAYGLLVVTTNVYLNGCKLKLDLGTSPTLLSPIMVISNTSTAPISGSFAGGATQVVPINGTNYSVSVNTHGGGGNAVVITTYLKPPGAILTVY